MEYSRHARNSEPNEESQVSAHFYQWLGVRTKIEKLSEAAALLERSNGCDCSRAEAIWDRKIGPLSDQLVDIENNLVAVPVESHSDLLMKIIACLDAGSAGTHKHYKTIRDEASKQLAATTV